MRNFIDNINPQRLKWCLNDAGMSPEDYHYVKPEKINEGKLTYPELKKFAQYFGYSTFFFLEKGAPEIDGVHSLEFRTLKNQQIRFDPKLSKLIRNIEKTRRNFISVIEDLKEDFPFQPPQLKGNMKQKAIEVRNWLGLDDQSNKKEFNDYRRALEAQNILVFQSMGYKGEWKVDNEKLIGLSIPYSIAPVIFVRKANPERQTFTLFHELAHLLLHGEALIDEDKNLENISGVKKEKEANLFAGLCLIPDKFLQDLDLPKDAKNCEAALQPIKERTGVSTDVILIRFLNEGKITRNYYEAYIEARDKAYQEREPLSGARRGSRKYRHREPLHIFGQGYVEKILYGLNSGVISLNKTSDYLDRIKVSDIHELEKSVYDIS